MNKSLVILLLCAVLGVSFPTSAGTVAYWRFEEGPESTPIALRAPDGVYYAAVADSSGNGNELSVWNETWAGYTYTTDAAFGTVPQTGAANHFSVRNNGTLPSMWTSTTDPINLISPASFTIEVTCKLENGDIRTIIGRDSYGTATASAVRPAL